MNRKDAVLFAVCAIIYLAIWLLWTVIPLAGDRSLAESDAVAAGDPVLGALPTQSVSKLVISGALNVMALVYALISATSPEERRVFPQLIIIAVLTFLGWMALNFWVASGFLNSPSTLLYGGVSIVLLLAWGAFMGRGLATIHDPLARFMMRFGLGLALFVTIVQLVSVLTPDWRSPTQGIPVLYTLTFNGLIGVFIGGFGGNMLWRERRAQVLAVGTRRR
jgi:hypothetical protein